MPGSRAGTGLSFAGVWEPIWESAGRCIWEGEQGLVTQALVGEHKEFGFYFECKGIFWRVLRTAVIGSDQWFQKVILVALWVGKKENILTSFS